MVGSDDALWVDFWVVGCCGFDCVCWAEVEVLMFGLGFSTVGGEGSVGWLVGWLVVFLFVIP